MGEPFARRVPARAPAHPPQHGRDLPPLVSAAGERIPGTTCHYVNRGIPEPAPGGGARTKAGGDVVSRCDFRRRRCAGIIATARRSQPTNRWQTRDGGVARALPGHPSAALAPQVRVGRRSIVGPMGQGLGGRSRARAARWLDHFVHGCMSDALDRAGHPRLRCAEYAAASGAWPHDAPTAAPGHARLCCLQGRGARQAGERPFDHFRWVPQQNGGHSMLARHDSGKNVDPRLSRRIRLGGIDARAGALGRPLPFRLGLG